MKHKNVINLNGFNDVSLMIFDDNNDKLDFSINFFAHRIHGTANS